MSPSALFATLLSFAAPAANDDFDLAEFERLHAELEPQGELWKTIPWHTELLPAQRQAAKEDKPLFLWAMDGHPLGCT